MDIHNPKAEMVRGSMTNTVDLKTFYQGRKLAAESEHAGFEGRNNAGLAEGANEERKFAKTNRLYYYLVEEN